MHEKSSIYNENLPDVSKCFGWWDFSIKMYDDVAKVLLMKLWGGIILLGGGNVVVFFGVKD